MAAIGFRILPRIDTNRALVALFEGIPASIISDNLSRLTGTWGLSPMHRPGTALLGTALTVRVRSGDNLMIHKALQLGRPGDVLVIDGNGCIDRALMGEIMKNVAMARGFAGVVLDGAIRDSAAFREDGFPCYARGVCHRGPYKDGPGEIGTPVSCGGQVVMPGDLIMADEDGVVVVPRAEAAEVIAAAEAHNAKEQVAQAAIDAGTYDRAWVLAALKAKGCEGA